MSRKSQTTTNQPTEASWYAIKANETGNEAEVMIYDAIGAWGISANQFVRDLNTIGADKITVRINTPGGEVYDATAIYNALLHHSAEVIVQIEGVAASAGSFIAMSGDEVRMADNAYMMIHEARTGVFGEAKDLQQQAALLEKMNDNIAGMYDQKAGKGRKYWRNLMAEETYFTAAEAKAEGLVDTVYKGEGGKASAFILQAPFNFADYKKMPEAVRELWGIQNKTQAPESSLRSEEQPGSTSKEQPAMATAIENSPPAQTPVAPAVNDSGEEKELDSLRKMTHQGIFAQGEQAGIVKGEAAKMAYFNTIIAACPDDPEMAIEAIKNGYSAEAVKFAHQKRSQERELAQAQLKAANRDKVRLEALIVNGGTPGVAVAMGIVEDDEPKMPPKQQAEWEWENKPAVRKTAKSKEIYVLARAAELDGSHKSFRREPVTV